MQKKKRREPRGNAELFNDRLCMGSITIILQRLVAFFFIFIFKKNKISKIYGRSKKFQKWAHVAHGEGDMTPVAQVGGDMPFFVKKNLQTGRVSPL